MDTRTCRICHALVEKKWYVAHIEWHEPDTDADEIPAPPEIPVEYQHVVPATKIYQNAVPLNVKREGDRGTWSHCGASYTHPPHTHDIHMTGESAYDIICNGTD